MQINELNENEWVEGVNQNLGRLSARLDALEGDKKAPSVSHRDQSDTNDIDFIVTHVDRICNKHTSCINCPLSSSAIKGITCLKTYAWHAKNTIKKRYEF